MNERMLEKALNAVFPECFEAKQRQHGREIWPPLPRASSSLVLPLLSGYKPYDRRSVLSSRTSILLILAPKQRSWSVQDIFPHSEATPRVSCSFIQSILMFNPFLINSNTVKCYRWLQQNAVHCISDSSMRSRQPRIESALSTSQHSRRTHKPYEKVSPCRL